ncbi:hypothetical protein PYCC9005_005583 [Savitreella phatthalungensis]
MSAPPSPPQSPSSIDENAVLTSVMSTLRLEASAINLLARRISLQKELQANLIAAISLINSANKVVVTGVGKSGIIARKAVAMLRSLAIVSVFLDSTDALHGDLGLVQEGDVVLMLSNSGKTAELLQLIDHLNLRSVKLVALCSSPDSPLGKASHVWLDTSVPCEATPSFPAPTCSTTLTLALIDALCVASAEQRQMDAKTFKYHHPGGSIGSALVPPVEL